MSNDSFWTRLKRAGLPQVVVVYLGASWGVLEVADLLQESLNLPQWVVPVAILLLAIGLLIILATAWVQSLQTTRDRAESGELPGAWDIAPGGVWEAIREGELPHLTWGRAILGGIAALWLLFGFAGLYVVIQDRGETFAPADLVAGEAADGIAIVPFTTRGEELDIWREGMVDLFAMSLDGVGGYRTIDSRTVMARWRDIVGNREESEPDLATVREVARQAGARYVMTGNVVSFGDDLRLQAELVDVESGEDVGAGRVQGPVDSVPTLVDRLSIEVAGDLLRASGSEVLTAHRAASRATSSLPALKAYLEGEAHFRHGDLEAARIAYERAVDADSTFALAHLRLSHVYGWTESISSERGEEHTVAAERMVDELGARDRAIVEGWAALRRGDLTAFERVKQATEKYPDDPEAHFILAEYHVHYGQALLLDIEQTREVLRKTLELDPNFATSYVHATEYAIATGDTAATRRLLEGSRRASGSDSSRIVTRNSLAADLLVGDSAAQAGARAALDTTDDRTLRSLFWALWHITERPAAILPLAEEVQERELLPPWPVHYLLLAAGKLEERGERYEELDPYYPPAVLEYEAWHWAGGPEPPESAVFPMSACGDVPHPQGRLNCMLEGAAWRIETGEREVVAEIASHLSAAGDSLIAAGDSSYGRDYHHGAAAVEAYALRTDEGHDAAIEALEPLTKQGHVVTDFWIRAWLADLSRQGGRLRDAIPYYESLRLDGLVASASFRLGQIYEELGRPDEAVEAYTTFLQAWEEADPDLPWLTEARAALEELLSEQG